MLCMYFISYVLYLHIWTTNIYISTFKCTFHIMYLYCTNIKCGPGQFQTLNKHLVLRINKRRIKSQRKRHRSGGAHKRKPTVKPRAHITSQSGPRPNQTKGFPVIQHKTSGTETRTADDKRSAGSGGGMRPSHSTKGLGSWHVR